MLDSSSEEVDEMDEREDVLQVTAKSCWNSERRTGVDAEVVVV